jgi:hypothetical protein
MVVRSGSGQLLWCSVLRPAQFQADRSAQNRKLAAIDPGLAERDFLWAANLETLPFFEDTNEFGGFQQTVG